MELRPAVLWTCLLGAGLALVQPSATSVTTSEAFPRPPRLIGCVFQIQSAVTCRWDPGDTPATSYTLQVQRKPSGIQFSTTNNSLKTFTCTTSGTNCSAEIHRSTVRIDFCISVIAHSGNHNISSKVRCQSGRIEVVLSPAILNSAQPVCGSPECLTVDWSRNFSAFPVANSEIQAGHLNSQIEFTTHRRDAQLDVQVRNVTVTGYKIKVCLFRPDTTYIIRLRHRYWGPASPWSAWSNAVQGRTAEDAPSAAPFLWRHVINPDMNGWRLISLLWKPLPHFLANGRILYYNVTCRTKSAQVLSDHGSCRDLHHASFSCNLLLPVEYCSCALTSSTSAGTSPEARIWFPGTSETELPAPSLVTASPWGDRSLEVHWTSPTSQSSMSGFVVEWFAVRDKTSSILHWEILNSSCRNLVLTEGVGPMERFAVSVRALYGARGAGRNRTLHIYTRQGAPSAGPHLEVRHISGSTVELSWIPVPVELLHGFLCNYTLVYKSRNQSARSVLVPAHVHHYTLENLSAGNYGIFVRANTVAGTGQDGNQLNVHIGSDEVSIVMSVAVPLVLMSVALMMITCLAQMKRVKQKLQQSVPNPSKSSLSHWNPELTFESMSPLVVQEQPEINNCKVMLPDKLPSVEQYNRYQSICKLLTYSSLKPSPLPVGILEKDFTRCSAEAKLTSATAYSSNPCIYSSILLSPTPENVPTPLQPYPNRPSCKCQPSTGSMIELTLQPGKDSESYEFPNEKKPCSLFQEPHQSPTSAPDFNNASHSSFLLYHQKEVSRFNMMLSHQSTTTTSPGGLSCLKSSLSPFHGSIFVDLTYLSVQCDSQTPSDI